MKKAVLRRSTAFFYAKKIGSVHFERWRKFELWYFYLKLCLLRQSGHLELAVHLANIRHQRAPRSVLVAFARSQHRLQPYDALAFHLPPHTIRFDDEPVPSEQLNSVSALVQDGNAVSKHVAVLNRDGLLRKVERFYTDSYALCGQGFHSRFTGQFSVSSSHSLTICSACFSANANSSFTSTLSNLSSKVSSKVAFAIRF